MSGPAPLAGAGSPLLTDLYQLTMMQAYLQEGMTAPALFTLSVRRLPERRNYLLACGLADVLTFLESIRFSDADVEYVASLPHMKPEFIEHLRSFRFTGDVYAVPEGTPVFADEPLLEIEAPLPQAQLVETFVLNQMHLQTMLASKAARVVAAAAPAPVFDFGLRRMHGADAAMKAARAFHIAGVQGTSNVLAGRELGIPVSGTMAHSYIQAHASELDAFRAFARLYPDTTLLVDTYGTLAGVDNVIRLAQELGDDFRIAAVRLDSGDLAELARQTRARLNAAGLERVRIFASGGLDEYSVARLVAAGAPIDAYGVGTAMGVSKDEPSLEMVYKLTEYAGRGRVKTAPGKPVLPGHKQVFRITRDGSAAEDVIARRDEELTGRPLLECVMRGGSRVNPAEPIQIARGRAVQEISLLPQELRSLDPPRRAFPVRVSGALGRYHAAVIQESEGTGLH